MKNAIRYMFTIISLTVLLAGTVSGQQFFQPVANTGETGAVVIEHASIDGAAITAGDEIGIYDGTVCVGAVEFEGAFPLSCSTVLEYQPPGGEVLPGARPGNDMVFKIWSQSADKVCDAAAGIEQGGHFGDVLTVVNTLAAQTTDVTGGDQIQPGTFDLSQNYPNPFNPGTEIRFSLASPEQTFLAVYDIAGRQIREILNQKMHAGLHLVAWDGKDDAGMAVPSGGYLLILKAGSRQQTRKMILAR